MRSSSSRPERTTFRRARRSATCGSLEVSRRTQADREPEQVTDQDPDRAARRPLPHARVGGVAAGGDRRQLTAGREPGEPDEDAEDEQRRRLAGELLFRRDRPPREEALAPDEPAEEGDRAEDPESDDRPVPGAVGVRRRRT